MPGLTGKTPGNGSNSLTYTIPGAGLDLESVYAVIDASLAATDVTAELTITDQSGVVIAKRTQSVTVPSGDTGSATWALRLDDAGAGGALTGAIERVAYAQTTIDHAVPSAIVTAGPWRVQAASEVYLAHFFCPDCYQQGGGVVQVHTALNAVEQALIASASVVGTTEFQLSLNGWWQFTGLTAGTYTLQTFSSLSGGGPATLKGGTGSAADLPPTFLAVYRVVG